MAECCNHMVNCCLRGETARVIQFREITPCQDSSSLQEKREQGMTLPRPFAESPALNYVAMAIRHEPVCFPPDTGADPARMIGCGVCLSASPG